MMVLVAGAAAGCSDDGKYLTGPEAIEWRPEAIPPSFAVKQKPEMKGTFSEYRGRLSVTVWDFPKGLTLQLGDEKAVVADDHSAAVSTDVSGLFAKLPASALAQAADLLAERPMLKHGLSLILTPKNRPSVTIPLPPVKLFDVGLSAMFEHVAEEKGLVFGGEAKQAPARHKSVFAVSPFVRAIVGEAATLGDIDAVAVTKMLPEVKGMKRCGGFADSSGRPAPAVNIRLKEAEVTIYDRRTGAELERRRFPPKEECPTVAMVKRGSNEDDSQPPKEEILAWLKAWTEGARPSTVEAVPVAPTK